MLSSKLLKVLNPIINHQKTTLEYVAKYATSASQTVSQTEPSKMEKSINSVQLLGRVGADPQRKGTETHPIAVFSMATHTNYRYESGEFLQRTDWHRIVCFKPGLRETIWNYLKKGQRVFVTGRLTYGEVVGEDGKPKSTTAIAAEEVVFLTQPPPSQSSGEQ